MGHTIDARWRQHIAAGKHLSQGRQAAGVHFDELMKKRGREEECRHLRAIDELAKFAQRGNRGRKDFETAAIEECAPDLER